MKIHGMAMAQAIGDISIKSGQASYVLYNLNLHRTVFLVLYHEKHIQRCRIGNMVL